LSRRAPHIRLPPEIESWSGYKLGYLKRSQEQPHATLSTNTAPLAAPVAISPQLDLAASKLHCLEGAKYTLPSCGKNCECAWKTCGIRFRGSAPSTVTSCFWDSRSNRPRPCPSSIPMRGTFPLSSSRRDHVCGSRHRRGQIRLNQLSHGLRCPGISARSFGAAPWDRSMDGLPGIAQKKNRPDWATSSGTRRAFADRCVLM
jgi:hypothetical protein